MSTQAKRRRAATVTKLPAVRRDGWSPQKQADFLRALAATHSVSKAAQMVGMSRQSAYRLRARLRNQPFDMAWAAAFQIAFDALAQAAMDRAINGVEVPHYRGGELVGTSRRFDERLTIALFDRRERFLRPLRPAWHEASEYEAGDFRGLLQRVEHGVETWRHDGPLDDSWPDDAGPDNSGSDHDRAPDEESGVPEGLS